MCSVLAEGDEKPKMTNARSRSEGLPQHLLTFWTHCRHGRRTGLLFGNARFRTTFDPNASKEVCMSGDGKLKVEKTDADWRKELTP